jgi:hypothetical protein
MPDTLKNPGVWVRAPLLCTPKSLCIYQVF